MGLFAMAKLAFGPKNHEKPKKNHGLHPIEDFEFSEHLTRMRPAQPVSEGRNWRHIAYSDYGGKIAETYASRDVGRADSSNDLDETSAPAPEDIDYWHNFDSRHVAPLRETEHQSNNTYDTGSIALETLGSFGFFAPREGGYQIGHVEELENIKLKRSSAIRHKTSLSVVHNRANHPELKPSARPFSWMLPAGEYFPPVEEIMAQQSNRWRTSDAEHYPETKIRSPPCPKRKSTMRRITLDRLEGRRQA